jgi:hypothetical protein
LRHHPAWWGLTVRRPTVTALITRGATDPLTPVTAALAHVRVRHGQHSLQGLAPGLLAVAPGWRPASHLLTTEGVGHFLQAAAQRWNAQPHAAAALAWKCYSYWVSLPAVLGFASARRVPLMTPDRVAVRYSPRPPFLTLGLTDPLTAVLANDPIAATDAPGLLVVPDEAALLRVLRTSLVEQHLEPIIGRIQQHVRLGHRTLFGSVASGIAYGLSRAADVLPGSTLEAAHTVLRALDADDLVELSPRPSSVGGGLTIQRRTCCLAFTLPTPKVCTGCCIRNS